MQTNHSRTLYAGKYFSLAQNTKGIEFVQTDHEVLVVPVTQGGTVILIREPSAAFGTDVLVLPGGTIRSDEDLATTANRELQEEIGLRANSLHLLGILLPFAKYLAVRSSVFLAQELVPSQLPGDEDYVITQHPVPLTCFEQMVESGELSDARVIAALYMVRGHFGKIS